MAGILGLGGGLLNLLQQPQTQQPDMQGGILGDKEALARALEWRQSVMFKGSPQTEMDRRASWYAAAGITPQDVRGGLLGVMTSPTQIAKAQEWASLAPFGLTVFHGSPHKFEKFDISKVGTGEGAQAYGHGLYFAERPAVAKSYAAPELAYQRASGHLGNKQEFIADMLAQGRSEADVLGQYAKRYGGSFDDAMADLSAVQKLGKGNLYKVDIPDEHIAKMLDWDKPLSQQPEIVKKALEAIPFRERGVNLSDENSVATLLHGMTRGKFNNPENAAASSRVSQRLANAGIPGIRYLDQGSRAGGAGTSNFVVFDPEIAKILERR